MDEQIAVAAREVGNLIGRLQLKIERIETMFRSFQGLNLDCAALAGITEEMLQDLLARARYVDASFTEQGPHGARIGAIKKELQVLIRDMQAVAGQPPDSETRRSQKSLQKREAETISSRVVSHAADLKSSFPGQVGDFGMLVGSIAIVIDLIRILQKRR